MPDRIDDRIEEIKLEVEKSSAFKKALFQLDFISCAIVSNTGMVIQASPRLCKELGLTIHQLTGMHFSEVTHPDDIEKDVELYRRLQSKEIPSYQMIKWYKNFKDHYYFQANLTVVRINETLSLGLFEPVCDHTITKKWD